MSESTRDRGFTPLEGLRPLAPPEELRGRVLAAATATLQREPEADLWAWLWFSRPLRLTWATIAVLLLVGHVLIPQPPPSVIRTAGFSVAGSIADFDVELQDIVNLPRISEDARVGVP